MFPHPAAELARSHLAAEGGRGRRGRTPGSKSTRTPSSKQATKTPSKEQATPKHALEQAVSNPSDFGSNDSRFLRASPPVLAPHVPHHSITSPPPSSLEYRSPPSLSSGSKSPPYLPSGQKSPPPPPPAFEQKVKPATLLSPLSTRTTGHVMTFSEALELVQRGAPSTAPAGRGRGGRTNVHNTASGPKMSSSVEERGGFKK